MSKTILHTFNREEVENLDLSRFMAVYGHWPQLWARELRNKFNSLILSVEGFSLGPRELWRISAVRYYFCALHEAWPWWAFFLHEDSRNIYLPYRCLIPHGASVGECVQPQSVVGTRFPELNEILRTDIARMCYLAEIAEMSDETMRARGCVVMRNFFPAFESPGDGFFGKENTKKDRNEQS